MADKHHSGKYTKSEQRKLLLKQEQILGMREDIEPDFRDAVVCFINAIDDIRSMTEEQNGRINCQLKALDRNSQVKGDYTKMLEGNKNFLEVLDEHKWLVPNDRL